MAEVQGRLLPDPNGDHGCYPVVSLYYDSPGLVSFWAKLDGVKTRRRLRLRIYPEPRIEATALGMVEIKQRTDGMVQKRRLPLPLPVAEQLCAGTLDGIHRAALDPCDRDVASEVASLVGALRLRPTAITAFQRRAFVGGPEEAELRLTFDSDFSGRVHALKVDRDEPNHRIIGSAWWVMEVKARGERPGWITALLERHGCQIQRMSKYCAVVSRLSHGALPPWVVTGNWALLTPEECISGGPGR